MNRLILPLIASLAAAAGAPLFSQTEAPEASAAVSLNGFGSDAPVERKDMPTRGIIVFGPNDHKYSPGSHWEQYDWKFTAKRWGHYQVRLTYTLKQATLGTQFKMDEVRLRKILTATSAPERVYFGTIHIETPGEKEFSFYTPSSTGAPGFAIQELALVPVSESGDAVEQAEDGSVTLHAKDAVTWSETMRYEPKPEKNCLGYWTDPADFAEWEFNVTKPGKYRVAVYQGCGGGNQGSQVAVKSGDQTLKFTVQDTGGFQKWSEIQAGELEIRTPGLHRLVVDPENKVKSAVLDVQKVVLTPVG